MARVRFMVDDPAALWAEGDEADWRGRESPHSDAPNIHVFKLADGQEIALTDPFERGLVELEAGLTLCPACQNFVADNSAEEIAHMEANHRDVIDQRLMAAGIDIHDYREGPDLPSYMTLREFATVMTFASKFAIRQQGFASDAVMIGIHVRDRGLASQMMAPWIEFSVGLEKYAIWRNTGDVYEVGADGAVADEPLHRND